MSSVIFTAPRRALTNMYRIVSRNFQTSIRHRSGQEFEEAWLEVLVCPLSKAPLRYDSENQELICDELKVAYPIVNGIPNLVPTDARKITEST